MARGGSAHLSNNMGHFMSNSILCICRQVCRQVCHSVCCWHKSVAKSVVKSVAKPIAKFVTKLVAKFAQSLLLSQSLSLLPIQTVSAIPSTLLGTMPRTLPSTLPSKSFILHHIQCICFFSQPSTIFCKLNNQKTIDRFVTKLVAKSAQSLLLSQSLSLLPIQSVSAIPSTLLGTMPRTLPSRLPSTSFILHHIQCICFFSQPSTIFCKLNNQKTIDQTYFSNLFKLLLTP